jgi:hypothetical protein
MYEELMVGKVTFSPTVTRQQDEAVPGMQPKQGQAMGVAELPEGVLGSKDPRRTLLQVCHCIPDN